MLQAVPWERAEQIKTIKAPTLVVMTGETHRLVPPRVARRYHESIAGSELVAIEKTSHLLQEERPERTAGEITRFLEAHP